jgi:hypothetical protein
VQFLWEDLFVVLPLSVLSATQNPPVLHSGAGALTGGAVTMTQPREELQQRRPLRALFSFPIFASVGGQLALMWLWMVVVLAFTTAQPWHAPVPHVCF